mgnify:CR=1 FL=1|jgi:hypothetical protein
MKKYTPLAVFIVSLMFSFPSLADWTKVTESIRGSKFFMDFQNVRKQSGKVFFWVLQSEQQPDRFGNWSNKHYFKVDCSTMGAVMLTGYYYAKPMGNGRHHSKRYPDNNWQYPPPNTPINTMIKLACRL